ncbi:MAG: hypothetical protein QM652_05610 [Legionella sp.]|uniref:PA3496 family putative envelope integrity protein n=1 Tax=Legionella sp. TaxID=459 RepID=UPI0039E49BBE
MSDLFEEDNNGTGAEIGEEFLDADTELYSAPKADESVHREVDARRRLESMLDEKRLRDELDDFGDY